MNIFFFNILLKYKVLKITYLYQRGLSVVERLILQLTKIFNRYYINRVMVTLYDQLLQKFKLPLNIV